MGIEIKGVGPLLVQKVSKTAGPTQEPSRGPVGAEVEGSSDKVSLTAASLHLHNLEQELARSPVVDAERVENIRARIADGTYRIDAERVASRLLDLEAALRGKP